MRREYEAAIAANKAKAAEFNLQIELGRLKERILGMLETLASEAELKSLLEEYGIDEESRTRILGPSRG